MLERPQYISPVEHLDVFGLRRRDAAHRPNQLDIVRLVRRVDRMHSNFVEQMTALPVVTGRACGHHVVPRVDTAPRDRHDMVAREEFAAAQLRFMSSAVLAPVTVTRKEERVGDLASEFAGDMNEADEANDGRRGEAVSLGMERS